MLFPFTRFWTRRQKWLMVGAVVVALAFCCACIFGYERYCRGPGQEMFYGIWKGTLDYHGSDAYFQFGADHTFSLWDRAWFDPPDKKPEFVTKGRWYAGGKFLYLRYPPGFRTDGGVLEFWLIDDISPQELRMRFWRDGGIHEFHRVDSVATRASNQTMERTPDRFVSTF
jgi:hypothetical protein